jgi:hypothetical protein
MATKGNSKASGGRKPVEPKDNDGEEDIAEAGHNVVKVNRRELKAVVELIDGLYETMESHRGADMERIKTAYDKHADALGIRKKNLRKAVKKHRDAKKEQAAYKEMEPNERDELDALILALGSYASSPLGKAAVERSERQAAAAEMGDGADA